MFSIAYHQVVNLGEAEMCLAIGFAPTLIALEMIYRMGRAIVKWGGSFIASIAKEAENALRVRDRDESSLSPTQPPVVQSVSFL